MLPEYEVFAIKYGEHQRTASANFLGGRSAQRAHAHGLFRVADPRCVAAYGSWMPASIPRKPRTRPQVDPPDARRDETDGRGRSLRCAT